MSGVGAKLSRHVLGMKFMRRTKDQIGKSGTPVSSPGAGSLAKSESSSAVKNEPTDTPTSKPSSNIEEVWSYNQCERYIFGRQSFGGFNPVVEKNVKKGVWKPFYIEGEGKSYDSSDDDSVKKQSDVDVDDEEMAKTYGSLIGTLAKRFQKKKKGDKGKNVQGKNNAMKKSKFSTKDYMKEEEKSEEGEIDSEEEEIEKPVPHKRHRESTGSNYHHGNRGQRSNTPRRGSPGKRHHNGSDRSGDPPQKKRKFMKPSD